MTIWILPIESVETRYTCQWISGIPNTLRKLLDGQNRKPIICIDEYPAEYIGTPIVSIYGDMSEQDTTPGAFLNFSGTNIWKSTQLAKMAEHFRLGNVKNGDRILVTDAWNTSILQIKYMIDLLGFTDVKIIGSWHAGQHDPQDFLGRSLPDKSWAKSTEQALFYAIDYNLFATNFYINMFLNDLFPGDNRISSWYESKKIVRSGQPHELLVNELAKFKNIPKENIIIFPHRLAPEKQLKIFEDLSNSLSESHGYKFLVCQDKKLTKDEYHTLLAKSKIMFSANLQETLGIGAMESILVNTFPLVPDRLSYSEMYSDIFKYPSVWSESWELYVAHKPLLINKIIEIMSNEYLLDIGIQKKKLVDNYLNATPMYEILLGN